MTPPTHTHGHTRDLTCTSGFDISSISSFDPGISEHKLVEFSLGLPAQTKRGNTMLSYRDLKSVDATLLSASISSSTISDVFEISCPSTILSKHLSVIPDILRKHAPIKTSPVPCSQTSPWYTPEP